MNDVHVFATGDRGRRLVQVIYRKPGRKFCTIERRNSKGELIGLEIGKRTLTATKDVSRNILASQRYRNVEFRRVTSRHNAGEQK
jgi:hypothetical protein